MQNAADFYAGVEQQDVMRRKALGDQYRQDQIKQYMGTSNNIQKHIALLMNPDTMQPLPGKEQQVAQLRQNLSHVDGYIKNLYNPSFDPSKGMVAEDPIHKLTDKLHLTKAPDTKTAGQQLSDLKDIGAKYSQEPSLLTPDEQKKAARVGAGLDPIAVEPKPAKPVLKPYKLKDGTTAYLDASKPENLPEGAQAIVPGQNNQRPKSQYDQQKEEFAKSLGKSVQDLTWADEQKFLKDRNPFGESRLAVAQAMLKIAQANQDLKQNQSDFSAYLQIQKQLAPLERIQTAADNAQEYVNNPSGPGDVGLVFAFIGATKPTSGFRFTETERKWILATRGLIEGAQTKINQGFTGETLSPDQRQNMAAIIKNAATQVRSKQNEMLVGASQFKPKAAAAASNEINPKKKVSLKKAMAMPQNKGKSEADVRKDIESHNYEVAP